MCPVTQQREFGMIARRIIHDQAKPLEASSINIIFPTRVAIIHEEVLVDIEILSNDIPSSLLLGLAIVQADHIALRVLIGTKVFIAITNIYTVFILNRCRFVLISIPYIFSRNAELTYNRRRTIDAEVTLWLLRADIQTGICILREIMLILSKS